QHRRELRVGSARAATADAGSRAGHRGRRDRDAPQGRRDRTGGHSTMTWAAGNLTTMRLSRLHYPLTELGPGRRAGVWFQGCTIRCPGCMSVDTWPRRPERAVPVAEVLGWLAGLGPVDGVTISGGEP